MAGDGCSAEKRAESKKTARAFGFISKCI